MPSKPDLPRDLRQAARQRVPRGTEPSPALLIAARRNQLTRSNTDPGEAGYKAVNKVETERRTARMGRPGGPLTAREATGHVVDEIRAGSSMGAIVDGEWRTIRQPTGAEKRRIARYDSFVGQLSSGRMSPREFQRKVSGWKPIRGSHFEPNPDVVQARLDARRAAGEPLWEYITGRSVVAKAA
jgi:hypothetical protein